jgi:hypothetical protein
VSGGIWDILEIAPTTDETAIRRAYAALLKRVRPDDDPEGFRRLRGAYEAALRGTATRAPPPPKQPVEPAATPVPAGETSAAPVAPSAEQRVAALIRRGDLQEAGTLLLTARGENTLALAPWMRLSDMLAARLAQDTAIPASQVERIATAFGWCGPGAQPATSIVQTLLRRIDAERWIATVRANAAKWTRFFGNDTAAASAMLLSRGRLGLAGILPPYRELVPLLSGALSHGRWAAQSLDEDRLARLRKLVLDTKSQQRRRLLALVITAIAFSAAGDSQAAFFCAVVMMRMRIALLRRFMMLALPLVAAAALAAASGDARAMLAVSFTTDMLCAGYFGVWLVGFAKAAGRVQWWRVFLRFLMLMAPIMGYLILANFEWNELAPILRGYGLDNQTGPLAIIGAGVLFVFIIRRAGGGGSDSMPRW